MSGAIRCGEGRCASGPDSGEGKTADRIDADELPFAKAFGKAHNADKVHFATVAPMAAIGSE